MSQHTYVTPEKRSSRFAAHNHGKYDLTPPTIEPKYLINGATTSKHYCDGNCQVGLDYRREVYDRSPHKINLNRIVK